MSAKHNSNVVIPDQLADVNDIESLFPKCPPKQKMFSGKNNKQNNRAFNKTNMAQPNKTKKRQIKTKNQQHRRELEARRNNKILSSSPNEKSSSSSEDNNNNNKTTTATTNTSNSNTSTNNSYKPRSSHKSVNFSTTIHDGRTQKLTNSFNKKSVKYSDQESSVQNTTFLNNPSPTAFTTTTTTNNNNNNNNNNINTSNNNNNNNNSINNNTENENNLLLEDNSLVSCRNVDTSASVETIEDDPSAQLLNLGSIENDNNVIRNDTSTEELCSNEDNNSIKTDLLGHMPTIEEVQVEFEPEMVLKEEEPTVVVVEESVVEKELINIMNKIDINKESHSNNNSNNINHSNGETKIENAATRNNLKGEINFKPTTRNINTITASESVPIPTRSSILQFNTLSDNESGPEESSQTSQHNSTLQNRDYITANVINKCDTNKAIVNSSLRLNNNINNNNNNNNNNPTNSSNNARLIDNLTPTIKTALIFPRLDEGLSSEAESCEDDVNEDDERAMEADVDADDDEDDDDVDDDCDDSQSLIQLGGSQARVDKFIQQQQQQQHQPHIETQSCNQGNSNQQHNMSIMQDQRSEQLKLNTNEINSNTDLQPVSNIIKKNTSSSEGSTQTDCEGRGEKEDRIHQAEMAVHEVKFRNGDFQLPTEVQLFISTEKIMVLDDKQRKIMMDHSLRTISYIADIGDAIVLIVRKKNNNNDAGELGRSVPKISCHVFESSESHTITKSISQAFHVAYSELLKANGGGEPNSYLPKELDYQEVLNSQEMSTDELEMFARKENQREVVVPKKRGEILGLSIVESGWGSVLPTVVIANLKQDGPAYNCKKLSIGDQILSVNGVSLVGLPLTECQEILKRTKNQRVAKLSVVPCPVTVEVKIKRPDTKYQLGFSVQNGVICSLLRGGIAERGGVRVGHRIMSINGTTVVGVPHEKIVTLLASSVGEIRMKTCLTSLYRLMLGDDKPKHI